MLARLLPALFALTVSAALPAAETADPAAAAPVAEAPQAPETPAATPAEPDLPLPPPGPAPAVPEAEAAAVTAAAALPPVFGNRVLFLRLTLRIKLVEQELLDMSPERLLEHMGAASELLEQLRSRGLDEDEAARADRAEQYLQSLTERYVELRTGKPPKKLKKIRR
ncbi:hypothetical protein D0B54_17200 [Solimonas sp. K1W22B-7]|uniref:hypothetical protein n=1 Tax=Solimonas sp. K1W22B-7 TaxID=2303331 RepID=UPI000E3301EB|nr:hypothetical protein [Solimonas sp. K1W22B-7]AXQ30301.1 hypothetical protein D0B54_17200 [Solimonas sp. K1W22B-7]